MIVKLRKLNQSEALLYIIVLLSMTSQFMIDVLHFPNGVRYIVDISLILCVLVNVKRMTKNIFEYRAMYSVIIVFILYSLITYCINYQSLFYYLWGFRNTFRFYIFFVLCIIVFNEKNVDEMHRFFESFFWINTLVCIFQFAILGISQDNLGGLFGTSQGCNGYLNIFLVIMISKAIVEYINKQRKITSISLILASSVIIAAMAELKFFFVEVGFIIALAILITHFSFRKLLIIVLACIGLYIGSHYLLVLFPSWTQSFSLLGLWDLSTSTLGYTGTGDLNRLNAIRVLANYYMEGPKSIIFGLGLGNCDYSSFSFLTSPFYTTYGWLHYTWLSHAFVFIEMGLLGLVIYFAFFVSVFFSAKRIGKGSSIIHKDQTITQILAIMAIVISIYNVSLRTEAGYMLYLFLSLAFCSNKITSRRWNNWCNY